MKKTFDKVIGIVGNPTHPDVSWSDEQLEAICDTGVDTLQLSIAWSWKPANEVLNLEDLDNRETEVLYKSRIEKAHRYGFKALAHFGIPRTQGLEKQDWMCIMDPAVIKNYTERLVYFFKEYDADEVMIYTYDQNAWLCSEYDDCPRCKGIPLHERLVPFLEKLVDAVQQGKPGAILWWEPWELTEGQIIKVIEKIRTDHFGIIMHSNIGEVNFINIIDLTSRNIARISKSRNIPFISEGFFGGSGEDIESLTHMPCPRLVYQQLDSMHHTYGITGIKEYYGFAPEDFSVNIALFSAYLKSPEKSLDDLLEPIAASYGVNTDLLLEAWESASQGMELFPYNASWWLRFLLSNPETQNWQKIKSADWDTPAWKASRRACYMVTNEAEQHPWLLEDVGLRACAAAGRFEKAAHLLEIHENTIIKKADIKLQLNDLRKIAEASRRFGNNMLLHRI